MKHFRVEERHDTVRDAVPANFVYSLWICLVVGAVFWGSTFLILF